MTLRIHNTQSGEKEIFKPLDPSRVTLYVCGPTVYNLIHIGNARPVVVFDTLYRLLKKLYPNVVYARNITDVDDKINAAAAAEGISIRELTDRYISAYHADITALNTLPPDIEPRATEHIQSMIDMTRTLVEKQHAYVNDGHVLFDVTSMPEYGELSHRKLEDLQAGARVEVADYKQHPADFVLWKPSTEELPGWDSPWGYGRPGWHLECSCMIETHLGETIDIHGGGQDLIFPHHENERAQSRCAHDGKPFVNYWMHNGYLTLTGEKMSKSLGNFFTLREILEQAQGEVVRFALLSGHYRSPLDWSEDNLRQAKAALDGLYTALRQVEEIAADADAEVAENVLAALQDDLNTPVAIAGLHELARDLNKATDSATQARLKGQLLASAELLGFCAQSPEDWFRWQPATAQGLDDAAIDALIEERNQARQTKDFARADAIRDELAAANIVLEDGAGGTQWKRTN